MKKQNEENACKAFITILNALTGHDYIVLESPDELNRQRPDVDFVLASDTPHRHKIAVEHAILESFEGQIGYVKRSYDIICSIDDKCVGKIPTDRYYFLAVPPQLVDSLVGENRRQFVDNISPWVGDSTQKLHINSSSEIDWRGHKILLMCSGNHPELNGHVWRMPKQPENQETLKSQRLHRLIRDKLQRLFEYKVNDYETALLIEDIAGSLLFSGKGGKEMDLAQRTRVRNIVDYIVIFASVNGRMVVGNVWKEKSVWYSLIPRNRRFSLRQLTGGGIAIGT